MGVIYQEGTYYGIDTTHVQAMPAATAEIVGKIVQYTGETTQSYHTGYFYKCSEDTSTMPSTYSWVNVEVQNGTVSRTLLQSEYDNLSLAEKSDGTVYYVTDPAPFNPNLANTGFTPIGTIISVMGNHAPKNYLKCDGTVYNIADYPELAYYFEAEFAAKNKFGGDGILTFAVPNLQGEFLRGAGTNSHTNQGNGGVVGVHQDATEEIAYVMDNTGNVVHYRAGRSDGWNVDKQDSNINKTFTDYRISIKAKESMTSDFTMYTSRPTNTSVLYCIAYKNIYVTRIDAQNQYSTEEHEVGVWIDGKTLYQKTYVVTTETTSADGTLATAQVIIPLTFNIVGSEGFLVSSSDLVPVSGYLTINNDVRGIVMWFGKSASSQSIFVRHNRTAYNNSPCYVTIRYTKTTD